jgi:hypothetical protein
MSQTKKKRRKKHRGTQAGIVERPHHRATRSSGSRPARGEMGFMFLLYIPMSYYTDKLIYNRRQAQKAKGS